MQKQKKNIFYSVTKIIIQLSHNTRIRFRFDTYILTKTNKKKKSEKGREERKSNLTKESFLSRVTFDQNREKKNVSKII